MARPASTERPRMVGFPHTRGDGPQPSTIRGLSVLISPHAWGWPVILWLQERLANDFPTRVGMARIR